MKHIYLFLTTLIISLLVIGCDRGEDPSYNELSVETTDIVLNLTKDDTKREVKILSDNKNYRLEYLNKSDADQLEKDTTRVEIQQEGNVFTFIGKKRGIVYFRLYDWTNQESLIKVDVQEEVENIVLIKDYFLFRLGDQSQELEIYDGNGGYEVTFDDPEQKVVEVNLVEPEEQNLSNDPYLIKGYITITPKSIGKTILKVTDSVGKTTTATLEVKGVPAPLQWIGYDEILVMETEASITIPFEGGEPEYSVVSTSDSNAKATIDNDTKTITVTTGRSTVQVTITLSDNSGQKLPLIIQVDKPFLSDNGTRLFLQRKRIFISKTKRGGGYIASLDKTILESGSNSTSYGITFTGDLTIGEKTAARIYKLSRGIEVEGSSVPLSECKLEQIEDNYYWFTFTEEDTEDKGYMVIQGPDELAL